MRISAALVFETDLPRALQQHFLTDFDLGAGRPNGAVAFGRLAALFASMGAPIAVFDIIKAFNNLRRKDIMAAVAAFNHPLLSAFVHFMFSRDSKVTLLAQSRAKLSTLGLPKEFIRAIHCPFLFSVSPLLSS